MFKVSLNCNINYSSIKTRFTLLCNVRDNHKSYDKLIIHLAIIFEIKNKHQLFSMQIGRYIYIVDINMKVKFLTIQYSVIKLNILRRCWVVAIHTFLKECKFFSELQYP